ncbi:uncharacterized protein PRCAT00002684001 [Priceomyces carsonii]|uniref:uncharacterized protein n=1 Tax=Priceomyces carsonii TaxID=28549 RepID=UPI002EDA1060|nr:unnamed protein product [Priceomyces carsonii]
MSSQNTMETMITAESTPKVDSVYRDESLIKDTSITTTDTNLTLSSTPPSSSSLSEENEKMKAENDLTGSELQATNSVRSAANTVTEINTNDESKETLNSPIDSSDNSDMECKDIARKLFNEEFVSIRPEEYTQLLASNDEESSSIRNYYMDMFKWDRNLLKSIRILCSKLYLKGESQEIDRILSAFSQSYIKQHPNAFFTKKHEEIYIIIYSLILLNTALHNSEVSKKNRISQPDYIRNTFTTFSKHNPKSQKKLSIKEKVLIERELGSYYDDLAKTELHLKQSDENTRLNRYSKDYTNDIAEWDSHSTADPVANSHELTKQPSNSSIWSDANNRRFSLQIRRVPSGASGVALFTSVSGSNSRNRVGFTRALASDQNLARLFKNPNYSRVSSVAAPDFTIKNRQSLDHLRGAPNRSNLSGSLNKRASRASIISKDSTSSTANTEAFSILSMDTNNIEGIDFDDSYDTRQQLEDFNVDDYQDHYDLTLELLGSPYLKEGLLKLKILHNDQQDNIANGETTSSSASVASTQTNRGASRFFSFFLRSSVKESNPAISMSTAVPSSILNKFIENFVVVSKGELSLYSFDPKIVKKHKQKTKKFRQKQLSVLGDISDEEEDAVGDGNWLKNAANVGNYNLCSTFAQMESLIGHSSNKKAILWSLTFPKTSKKAAKKFIFEAGTKEIALEFVNTCNFWASKITAIPASEESVSSIEYGWTNLEGLIANKSQFKKLKHIGKWEPISRGIYLSNFVTGESQGGYSNHAGMMKQFVKTMKYYHHLKKSYHEFTLLRTKFVRSFPLKDYNCSNLSRVLNNYELKMTEYKEELNKYKNYLIILGFALQLRFDLEQQDKESQVTSIDEDETLEPELEDYSDELTKLVKSEIRNLFINMKDVGNVIPTFQSSRSIQNLTELARQQVPNDTSSSAFPLVKSPKTFTLSNYKDTESPINQLLQSSAPAADGQKDLSHSYSTNTIKEEDEPDDQEQPKKTNINTD